MLWYQCWLWIYKNTSWHHRFILFENLKFFSEKIVHIKSLGKSLLIQRHSTLYIVGITKGSWFHAYNYHTNIWYRDIHAVICSIEKITMLQSHTNHRTYKIFCVYSLLYVRVETQSSSNGVLSVDNWINTCTVKIAIAFEKPNFSANLKSKK